MTVLFVDRSAVMREMAVEAFARKRIPCVAAASNEEAGEYCIGHEIELVLTTQSARRAVALAESIRLIRPEVLMVGLFRKNAENPPIMHALFDRILWQPMEILNVVDEAHDLLLEQSAEIDFWALECASGVA